MILCKHENASPITPINTNNVSIDVVEKEKRRRSEKMMLEKKECAGVKVYRMVVAKCGVHFMAINIYILYLVIINFFL